MKRFVLMVLAGALCISIATYVMQSKTVPSNVQIIYNLTEEEQVDYIDTYYYKPRTDTNEIRVDKLSEATLYENLQFEKEFLRPLKYSGKSDKQIILAIIDEMYEHGHYDYSFKWANGISSIDSYFDNGGYQICEGFSKTFDYMCNYCGIPCCVVYGMYGDEGHAWNRVMINNQWYNVDVTSVITHNKDMSMVLKSTNYYYCYGYTLWRSMTWLDVYCPCFTNLNIN